MPTDLTLVFRNSANCAETAFASGGSDGRSARVGDRALASSSKAWQGKGFVKRGSNSPTKTPFTTKAALKIHDAPITAYLITRADSDPHWTKYQRFQFHSTFHMVKKSYCSKTFFCENTNILSGYPVTHWMEVAHESLVRGVKGVEQGRYHNTYMPET